MSLFVVRDKTCFGKLLVYLKAVFEKISNVQRITLHAIKTLRMITIRKVLQFRRIVRGHNITIMMIIIKENNRIAIMSF